MSEAKVYLKEGFFKFLVSMEMLKEKKEKYIFLSSLGISEEDFEEFRTYLMSFNLEILFDDQYVYPLKEQHQFHLNLNLSEWFSLQLQAKDEKDSTDYAYKILKNKIEMISREHQRFNLFKKMNKLNVVTKAEREVIIRRAEFFTIKRSATRIKFINNNFLDVFPLRLVFLDGILSFVAESVLDKTICYFAISEIAELEELSIKYNAHVSQIEINDFISNLRLINGNEERLILKIFSPGEMDLLPKHHFLGNPFVTSNNEGDMIWAASIEMCDDVYEWLYQMKDQVEILDPGHIRKDFAHYCELQKEMQDSKKAG